MKLATYRDGSRDGQLLVVSRDLSTAHYATGIADRLQQVLDDWNFLSPQLQDLYETLNHGKARHAFAFDPRQCMAPLPRAYQWAVGNAYPGLPAEAADAAGPRLLPGAGDALQGACEAVVCPSDGLGIDFEAQLAVLTGDLPAGASAERALEGIRLVALANAVRLRHPDAQGPHGVGDPVQSWPASAFSPVAVTPDALGEAWADGRVHLTLLSTVNARRIGLCDAGSAMRFHFGELLSHLCRTRRVRAGTIVGSGPVSDPGVDAQGRPGWPRGTSCIAHRRALEALHDGAASTNYLTFGDTVRIEMKGRDGQSVFGAIDHQIVAPGPANPLG